MIMIEIRIIIVCIVSLIPIIEILEIDRNSNLNDIKKAYFTLAKKYHPDVSKEPNAKELFTQISEAYDTLSDDNKRRAYDQTGRKQNEPFSNYNYYYQNFNANSSFFKDLFDNINDLFNNDDRGNDIALSVTLDFMEAVNGCVKEVRLNRVDCCFECKGSRCKLGTKPLKCYYCNGEGRLYYRRLFMNYEIDCSNCNGEGNIIKDKCLKCNGKGHMISNSIQRILIPKGVDNGVNLRIANMVYITNY